MSQTQQAADQKTVTKYILVTPAPFIREVTVRADGADDAIAWLLDEEFGVDGATFREIGPESFNARQASGYQQK